MRLWLVLRTSIFVFSTLPNKCLQSPAARSADQGILHRADLLCCNVVDICMKDESVDLGVSRGSVFFWEDLPRALTEIYRVLAPSGWAYIGGGFGSAAVKADIARQLQSWNHGDHEGSWQEKLRHNLGAISCSRFINALKTSGIPVYVILQGEAIGLWIAFQKLRKRNENGTLRYL